MMIMETYKIKIDTNFYLLMPEIKKICGYTFKPCPFEYKKIGEAGSGIFAETELEIKCENADTLFWIGFFLEREREYAQRRQYDLRDSNEITITVPDAFLLVCKAFDVSPSQVLALFAGDLSQHPFTTGGSDERNMAMDYFLRGASALDGDGEEHNADEIFYQLDALRRSWKGNDHQEEFKQRYRDTLQELDREISAKKKGGKQ